jgi:hypothetical protein
LGTAFPKKSFHRPTCGSMSFIGFWSDFNLLRNTGAQVSRIINCAVS